MKISSEVSKIKNWQQLISAIAIFGVTEIASVLKPETALHSTSIGLSLVLLMFYIVKRSTIINNTSKKHRNRNAKRKGTLKG